MGKMMRRNRKKSRIAYTPFSRCFCCDGPTFYGRAAEKRQWRRDDEDLIADELRMIHRRRQPDWVDAP